MRKWGEVQYSWLDKRRPANQVARCWNTNGVGDTEGLRAHFLHSLFTLPPIEFLSAPGVQNQRQKGIFSYGNG